MTFKARLLSSARPGIESRSDEFRRDLLAHLNTLLVRVPPLREYTEDVPDLLRHYVDRFVDGEGLAFRKFSVAAQNRLRNYPWPDNVRELKNLVQRLLLQGGSEEIRLEEIERELAAQAPTAEPLVKQDLLALPLREAREQFERAYLQQQLLLCNGKVGQLAKRVGMERTHLYRKLRSLGSTSATSRTTRSDFVESGRIAVAIFLTARWRQNGRGDALEGHQGLLVECAGTTTCEITAKLF